MATLKWSESGTRNYEMGVSKGVLYPMIESTGAYDEGEAWNGLINVTDSPEGAEATDLYADNIKYASFRSAEKFKWSLEAYAYPTKFAECDGTVSPVAGVYVGQQDRKPFGFCYRVEKGNDTMTNTDDGYILHLIYNSTASPTEKSHDTINDSPDAATFSWDCDTTPVAVTGMKPTSEITIDSTVVGKVKMKKLEDQLYGTASTKATLPSPDEVIALLKTA